MTFLKSLKQFYNRSKFDFPNVCFDEFRPWRFAEIYRDKTMADKLMLTPNDYTQNFPFYKLQLVFEMFEYSS